MAAYAVIARIGRVDPHLTMRELDFDLDPDLDDLGGPRRGVFADAAVVAVDVVRASEPGLIGERIGRFRDRWAQVTFFLFDPQSWRI